MMPGVRPGKEAEPSGTSSTSSNRLSAANADKNKDGKEEFTNLIVTYLPAEYTETDLEQLFGVFGKLVSTRVVRQHGTGRSRGFGFVDYAEPAAAKKALESLDKLRVSPKKQLKVCQARPREESEKNCNLHINGLPRTWDKKKLFEVFRPFGQIVSHRILEDIAGHSKGIGFVRFDKRYMAQAAVEGLDGTKTADGLHTLVINFARAHDYDDDDVQEAAANGSVSGIGDTSYTRRYTNSSQATNGWPPVVAANNMYGLPVPYTVWMPCAGRLAANFEIYIGNIDSNVQENELRSLFELYGPVHSVKIVRRGRRLCSFGFANIPYAECAVAAVRGLNQFPLRGRPLFVSFKEENPRRR